MFRRLFSATTTPAVAARSFASTPALLKVNPYSMFMKLRGSDEALNGLTIPQRGKMLAKWYRALSAHELSDLKKQGATVNARPRQTRKARFIARFQHTVRGQKFSSGKARREAGAKYWAKLRGVRFSAAR